MIDGYEYRALFSTGIELRLVFRHVQIGAWPAEGRRG
jgi:hypothetical protein